MAIEIGEPKQLGESPDIFSVGIDAVSVTGKVLATGTVTVDVSDDDTGDGTTPAQLAKQKARAMVADQPGLLTVVRVSGGATHRVTRADGTPLPWDGDGFKDVPDTDHGVEPKRIISIDSPQAGQ